MLNFPRADTSIYNDLAILDNISIIYKKMSHAAMRAGREPHEVGLVAITKTVPVAKIREALDSGLRVFGESKVQEASAKASELADEKVSWHMVGHLQRNKAKAAVGLFELIHSVDSLKLMEALDRYAREIGKVQRILIQVDLAGEKSKSGVSEKALEELAAAGRGMRNVKVDGLMTIPPFFEDQARARTYFRRLRELNAAYGYPQLSMGMSGDFEVAIEEGSTLVRVGTAIFGERDYS